jgi:hypothetical protein
MQNNTLTSQQSQAVIHLIEADTLSEAARRTGVSRPTLYAWLKEPAFSRELDSARRAEHQARLNALTELLPKALKTLSGLLESEDPQVRLKASSEIVKAYQALADRSASGPEPAPLVEEGEAWSEEDVPTVAQRCLEGLINGKLDGQAASMVPRYLWFLDKSLKEQKTARAEASKAKESRQQKVDRAISAALGDPAFRKKLKQVLYRYDRADRPGDDNGAEEKEEALPSQGSPGPAQGERVLS